MKTLSFYYYLLIILSNFDYQSVSCMATTAACTHLSSIKVECKHFTTIQQLNLEYKTFWKSVHIINGDVSKAYFNVESKY